LNHGHADFQSKAVEPKTAPCSENSVKLDSVIQSLSGDLSNSINALQPRVREAALWLYLNRSEVSGNVLVALRRKFALTIMEATDAANAAHKLIYR
jgi:hypothetical protein